MIIIMILVRKLYEKYVNLNFEILIYFILILNDVLKITIIYLIISNFRSQL